MYLVKIIQGSVLGWFIVTSIDQHTLIKNLLEFSDLLIKLSTDCEDYTFKRKEDIEEFVDYLQEDRELEMSGDNGNWKITIEFGESFNSKDL